VLLLATEAEDFGTCGAELLYYLCIHQRYLEATPIAFDIAPLIELDAGPHEMKVTRLSVSFPCVAL